MDQKQEKLEYGLETRKLEHGLETRKTRIWTRNKKNQNMDQKQEKLEYGLETNIKKVRCFLLQGYFRKWQLSKFTMFKQQFLKLSP